MPIVLQQWVGAHLVILTTPALAKLQVIKSSIHLSQLQQAPALLSVKYSCQYGNSASKISHLPTILGKFHLPTVSLRYPDFSDPRTLTSLGVPDIYHTKKQIPWFCLLSHSGYCCEISVTYASQAFCFYNYRKELSSFNLVTTLLRQKNMVCTDDACQARFLYWN